MGKYEDLKVEYARLEEKCIQLQKQLDLLTTAKAKLEQDLLKQTTSGALLAKELEDLRKKNRESSDDALGTSMELEKVRENLKNKEQELNAINTRIKGLTSGGSGILTNVEEDD